MVEGPALGHLWAATCSRGSLAAPALAFEAFPDQGLRLPSTQGRKADSLKPALSCPSPPWVQMVNKWKVTEPSKNLRVKTPHRASSPLAYPSQPLTQLTWGQPSHRPGFKAHHLKAM